MYMSIRLHMVYIYIPMIDGEFPISMPFSDLSTPVW